MGFRSNFLSALLGPANIFVVLITLWIIWLWRRRHFYKFCWNFPTFWGVPVFGMLPHLKHPDNAFYFFAEKFEQKKTDSVAGFAGLYPLIITKDLDFIDFLLTRREFLDKAHNFYHPIDVVLQSGMVTNCVKDWLPVRPLMEPSFKRDVLLSLFPIINKRKTTLIENLNSLANGKRQKIMKIIEAAIVELTMETTMGIREEKYKRVSNEFVENILSAVNVIPIKMCIGTLNLEWLLTYYKRREIKSVHAFLDKLIKEHIGKKEENGSETDADLPSNIFIKNAIKLYQNNQLSWKQIRSESFTVFAAAFETTSIAVFSTLVLLAMHTDIQEKVYAELRNAIGDPNRDINYEDFSHLPYLDIVLKEVMRVIPPVPLIGRQITKNTEYKNWNTIIPKDFQVAICIFHLHRHTGIWGPDAEEFRPSRFLEENLTSVQKRAYMPFSKGPRNCIGSRYAQFAVKVFTAGILLNYQFETDFKYKDLKFGERISTRYLIEPFLSVKKRTT